MPGKMKFWPRLAMGETRVGLFMGRRTAAPDFGAIALDGGLVPAPDRVEGRPFAGMTEDGGWLRLCLGMVNFHSNDGLGLSREFRMACGHEMGV